MELRLPVVGVVTMGSPAQRSAHGAGRTTCRTNAPPLARGDSLHTGVRVRIE